jgi:hypothetical protein
MKTNQIMEVQIGNFGTITIGHQTKMGDVAQVIEIGNKSRADKGLEAIPIEEILRKPYFWEFVISRNTQKSINSNSGESPELKKIFKPNHLEIEKYKTSEGKIRYFELMKKYPNTITSKRGRYGGTKADFYILLYIIEIFGFKLEVNKEVLINFLLLKQETKKFFTINNNYYQKVYLLTDGFYYKIGIAKNVKNRINKLQIGNPHKIREVFSYEQNNALKIEKVLHKKFKRKQMNGEWFDLNISDVQIIKNYLENNSKKEK